MTAIKASDVDRYIARPDPAQPIVLVYGPDAGLVRERAERVRAVENFQRAQVAENAALHAEADTQRSRQQQHCAKRQQQLVGDFQIKKPFHALFPSSNYYRDVTGVCAKKRGQGCLQHEKSAAQGRSPYLHASQFS